MSLISEIITVPYHPEFKKVCRLCCKRVTEKMQSIYSFIKFRVRREKRFEIFKVADIIINCDLMTVELNDELPTEICESCLSAIKRFYIFKVQCQSSYNTFQEHLNKKKCILKQPKEVPIILKLNENKKKINNTPVSIVANIKEDNIDSDEMEVEYLEDEDLGLEETKQKENNAVSIIDISDSENVVNNEIEVNNEESIEKKNESKDDKIESKDDKIESKDDKIESKDDKIESSEDQFIDIEQSLEKLFENAGIIIYNDDKIKINFKCRTCRQEFETKAELAEHENEHDVTVKYLCKHCLEKYLTPNLLMLHIAEIHKNLENYSCVYPNCTENVTTTEELLKHNDDHIIGHHKKTLCDLCDKIFLSEDECKVHRESHVGGGFQCNVCAKIFLREGNLKIHRSRHDTTFSHLCALCGKQFLSKGELYSHSRTHYQRKEDECDVCFKRFKCKASLKNHYKIHDDLKPYLCPKCGVRFNHKGNLETHLLRHEGSRNFKCIICDEQCYSGFELKAHIRKHTGELPYICKICDKKFRTTNGLKNHMGFHAMNKLHKCKICSKFFSKSGLLSHMKRHEIIH